MEKEVILGIVGHADEVTKQWHKAYKAAVESDNQDAIQALLKVAPKLKRVFQTTKRIVSKQEDYAAADRVLARKPESTGKLEDDLTLAAARAGFMRKSNSLHKFVKEVESL